MGCETEVWIRGEEGLLQMFIAVQRVLRITIQFTTLGFFFFTVWFCLLSHRYHHHRVLLWGISWLTERCIFVHSEGIGLKNPHYSAFFCWNGSSLVRENRTYKPAAMWNHLVYIIFFSKKEIQLFLKPMEVKYSSFRKQKSSHRKADSH